MIIPNRFSDGFIWGFVAALIFVLILQLFIAPSF